MGAYVPFFLPLSGLDGSDERMCAVAGPLEEEEFIRKRSIDPLSVWKDLRSAVEDQCAIRLIVELPPELTLIKAGTSGAESPERVLIADQEGQSLFLMEHPDGLIHFDEKADADQLPVIVRPSLFAQLWRNRAEEANPTRSSAAEGSSADQIVSRVLSEYVESLVEKRFPSDWHLEPTPGEYASRLRVDGRLQDVGPVPAEKGQWLIQSLRIRAGIRNGAAGAPAEGICHFALVGLPRITLRLSTIPTLHGYAMTARFLYPDNKRLHGLDSLGMDPPSVEVLRQALSDKEGLWLSVGPTGSGKSTTLHALLRQAVAQEEKVLAVEDPVELTITGVQHLSVGTPAGLTYTLALKAFLRQSPDCLLIGEIRDEETASIALQAARTGHRVLSTLHARDDQGILRRFADLGQTPAQLQLVCRIIIHQRLVPALCPDCRTIRPIPRQWLEGAGALPGPWPEGLPIPGGCQDCQSGYRGRIGLFSVSPSIGGHAGQDGLLRAAWSRFRSGSIAFDQLLPFLPPQKRACFQSFQA